MDASIIPSPAPQQHLFPTVTTRLGVVRVGVIWAEIRAPHWCVRGPWCGLSDEAVEVGVDLGFVSGEVLVSVFFEVAVVVCVAGEQRQGGGPVAA